MGLPFIFRRRCGFTMAEGGNFDFEVNEVVGISVCLLSNE